MIISENSFLYMQYPPPKRSNFYDHWVHESLIPPSGPTLMRLLSREKDLLTHYAGAKPLWSARGPGNHEILSSDHDRRRRRGMVSR